MFKAPNGSRMLAVGLRAGVVLAVTSAVGCTGSIVGGSASREDDGASNSGGGGRAGAGGTMAVGGRGGSSLPPSACSQGAAHGPVFLRRLANDEYDHTIQDLLGYAGRPSVEFALVPDTRRGGFDTNAEGVTLSGPVFEKYEAAAQKIAAKVTASVASVRAVTGCDPVAAGCLATFVSSFGRRAFRRPVTDEEKTALLALAETGSDPADKVGQVLQGILLSPSFLYRPEVGVSDPAKPGLVRLNGFEIATRLSYTFLRTTPSNALLDAAERGDLDTEVGVEKVTRELLAKTEARAAVRNFLTQWFRLDSVKGLRFEPKKYTWSEDLGASMIEETNRLLEHVAWTRGARFVDVLDAPFTFADARLAKHYGVAAPAKDWDRVELGPNGTRGGLMTQGSVLALTSKPDHVSGILRGKFVREAILCTPIAPPPPSVPPLSDPLPGESEQQRFERHTKDPACAACHRLLDPIGFGLGRYDAVGALRAKDDQGRPIETSGSVIQPDETIAFDGGIDLGKKLKQLPDVGRCVVTHAFRYALGRLDRELEDECAIAGLEKAFVAAEYSLPEMLVALAKSEVFRYRQPVSVQKGEQP